MVGAVWWNYWSMISLFMLISLLGLWEFYTLLETRGIKPQKVAALLFTAGIFGAYAFYTLMLGPLSFILLNFLVPAFGLIAFFELFRKLEDPLQNIGFTILGVIYVAVPFLLLSQMGIGESNGFFSHAYDPLLILGFFFLVWSNDTFAYLVGRTMGRTKLFERISPKKTWEGTVGGALLTLGVAWVLSLYFTELSLLHWLVTGLIVSITATLGDLVESMFKRSLGVKDSGTLLPGHGGILDRFDGVLLSAPFVCVYWMLIR